LKAEREKQIPYKCKPIKVTAEFSTEFLKARRDRERYFGTERK
jgi:hypothetical protein